jgi:hypothetical protein
LAVLARDVIATAATTRYSAAPIATEERLQDALATLHGLADALESAERDQTQERETASRTVDLGL